MNSKKAKALRRELNYHPAQERKYVRLPHPKRPTIQIRLEPNDPRKEYQRAKLALH